MAHPAGLPKLSAGWARLCDDIALHGKDWSAAAGELADGWLRQAFDLAVSAAPGGGGQDRRGGALSALRARRDAANVALPSKGLALLAVGSLGRGDLAPGSDLDLLLVHDGRPDVVEVADRLWYPIWDDPMPLDHSVRTLSQVGQAAESDLRVAQGLLDARPLAGDAELGTSAVALGRRLWEKRVGEWLPAVWTSRARVQAGRTATSPSCSSPSFRRAAGVCATCSCSPSWPGRHPGDWRLWLATSAWPRRRLPARGPGRAAAAETGVAASA